MIRRFQVIDAEQRSPEWFKARIGRLTASRASDMMDILKDGKSDGYKRRDLRAAMVCERLTGESQDDGYVNTAMQWGIDHESEAFDAYEAKSGNLVRRTGFLQHTEHMAGCSLDGDVDDFSGVLELKCPKSSTHLSYLKANGVPQNHMPQVLHHLWITGAKWCDFVSYDPRFPPALRLFVCRVPRNDIELVAYERVALKFLKEIEDEVAALEQRMAVPA